MQIQNLPRKACCGAIGVTNCFKPMNLPKPGQFSPCIFDIIRPKNNSNKEANFLLKPKTYMYILTNTVQIPFNISNESVLFLDNSLVMHSVKISFLLQPDKGLFCLSVEDKSFMDLLTVQAKVREKGALHKNTIHVKWPQSGSNPNWSLNPEPSVLTH